MALETGLGEALRTDYLNLIVGRDITGLSAFGARGA